MTLGHTSIVTIPYRLKYINPSTITKMDAFMHHQVKMVNNVPKSNDDEQLRVAMKSMAKVFN